ncbi:hypothetical protein PI95_011605 [Hassallia byssoidea VB512170]|uniref:Uncharacterized protein n=1 Tax=Hassallia byssoidea VB512170 TaxID=1304833 RepID=A0A846H9P6_9CYAN|nr:hypothetical protein [Hassalia byssoidea]NEU73191.1 hypothetical protein [Hassalia byssoidea VB512170]
MGKELLPMTRVARQVLQRSCSFAAHWLLNGGHLCTALAPQCPMTAGASTRRQSAQRREPPNGRATTNRRYRQPRPWTHRTRLAWEPAQRTAKPMPNYRVPHYPLPITYYQFT